MDSVRRREEPQALQTVYRYRNCSAVGVLLDPHRCITGELVFCVQISGLTRASSRHAPLASLAPRAADAQAVRPPETNRAKGLIQLNC